MGRTMAGPRLGGPVCAPEPLTLFFPWQTERLPGICKQGTTDVKEKIILRTLEPTKTTKYTGTLTAFNNNYLITATTVRISRVGC